MVKAAPLGLPAANALFNPAPNLLEGTVELLLILGFWVEKVCEEDPFEAVARITKQKALLRMLAHMRAESALVPNEAESGI